MNQKKLEEVLKDEAYVKELLATEKPEDVQASLEAKGVGLTLDEIKQLGEVIKKVQKGEITQDQLERAAAGELSEDELEEVSGGFLGTLAIVILAALSGGAVGAVVGVATGW